MVSRRNFVLGIAAILALVLAVVLYLAPQLRVTAALLAGGLVLVWVRQRFFHVPGIQGIPFARTRRLLNPQGARRLPRVAEKLA